MRTNGAVLLAVIVVSASATCAELRVPEDADSIQQAVAQASAGDLILITPGTYYEDVWIEFRKDLVLRGEVTITFDEERCWESTRDSAMDVIIVGTIHIFASSKISIETLTVTGSGAGITVDGTTAMPSTDTSIFGCNLVCNEGMALELGERYLRLAVTCSNVCQNGENALLDSSNSGRRADVFFTCNRAYDAEDQGQTDLLVGDEIVVAVIDSGIDWTIPALACQRWVNAGEIADNGIDDDGNGYVDDLHGWDYQDDDPNSLEGTPIHWHGTFVAGVLVDAFESMPPLLTAPPRLRIMDLRFLDENSFFLGSDWPNLVRAIKYAVDNGARLINLSIYATKEPPSYVREAVESAVESGVTVVSIAGNDPTMINPLGAWPGVIAVAAISEDWRRASFSGVGPEVDLASYGVNVLSLLPGGASGVRSGTSFAAPRVAGLAAFYIAENPTFSPWEIERLLIAGALDIGPKGHDTDTGHGVIE